MSVSGGWGVRERDCVGSVDQVGLDRGEIEWLNERESERGRCFR